jgi:uncharacterized protein (TIGR00299 family) protein
MSRNHIHLDLVGGLAGDMFVASAIDAGLVDIDALQKDLQTLGLGTDIEIVAERSRRGAFAGTHVKFAGWDPDAESDHRHLTTIRKMIMSSGLTETVKSRAIRLFEVLGAAEAAIHGVSLDDVHFHEVGAVDSILDFVSAAWIIEAADATWSCGEVPAGRGSIETANGTIPVPAPATARLLRGMRLVPRDVEAELVTPTGAAILVGLQPAERSAGGRLRSVGYGLGTRELGALSNVVRLTVFTRSDDAAYVDDRVVRVETDIDDMTAEQLASADEALYRTGALDVSRSAIQMKKGRIGTRITVLAPEDLRANIIDALFEHTTTFGVRVDVVERVTLTREVVAVQTEYGRIDVKLGRRGDALLQIAPEHAQCEAAAREHGVSVRVVHYAAYDAARRGL